MRDQRNSSAWRSPSRPIELACFSILLFSPPRSFGELDPGWQSSFSQYSCLATTEQQEDLALFKQNPPFPHLTCPSVVQRGFAEPPLTSSTPEPTGGPRVIHLRSPRGTPEAAASFWHLCEHKFRPHNSAVRPPREPLTSHGSKREGRLANAV